MKLKNKICLIAGASSGMGRQTALSAAKEGASVIVAARRLDQCQQVVDQIKADNGKAMALAMDGTQPDSVDQLIDQIDAEYGRLDVVFNNLGHTFGFSAFHETPLERWEQSIETNLNAIFRLMRAEIPLLLKSGGGSIVNNSSTGGLKGTKSMADYSAAKWGVIGLTKSVALEYAEQNIRCNVIAPGIIATEKFEEFKAASPEIFDQLKEEIPAKRFGHMQDIANAVTWLLSDEAAYINGATIPIDAGRTA